MKKLFLSSLTGALVLFLISAGSYGGVLQVPSKDFKTIQSAIDASAHGDTVLVGPGMYKENLVVERLVSLVSTEGPARTTIDAQRRGAALTYSQVPDSTGVVRGFTFKNGVGLHGGGVLVNNAFITVEGNVFVGDSARYGGALCVLGSNSSIRRNTFKGNSADYGGALYTMFLSPTIDSNTVEENRASIGGGLYLGTHSGAKVRGNVVRGNRAERGGGLFMNKSAPEVEDNLFVANRAEEGGGISSFRSTGQVRRNVLWKNHGARGAAVALADTSSPDIERNTLAFNSATDTLCAGLYTSAVFTRIVNNIFLGNSPGYAVYCVEGAYPVLSCNIFWDNETGNYLGLPAEPADIHADPLFCAPGDGDFTLRGDSPALGGPCGTIGALREGCEAPEEAEQ
ncbi:MAG: hypothetical protein JSW03_05955 [Candidatus Eiseniibacteriota bacterium]|nr:MAG: hypothetical protein JSW03_05955 [Candidatus Eisenbacteria bacterium]